MATQLDNALAAATLSDPERRAMQRFVALLGEELGEDLRALWLYGSRARGEANLAETDIDRMSDIDLLLIVDASRGWDPYGREIIPMIDAAADAEGISPVWFSAFVRDPEWLRGRRKIESFFIQEVDRDKIVLAGSALDGNGS